MARADSRGMKINNKKTKVLCISDANTFSVRSHLYDSDSLCLDSGHSMKILGFHSMSSRPTCHAHVSALQARMHETTWILRHLSHSGFTEVKLATVYKTIIRLILDYCCVVYHSMLTDNQEQQIERLQSRALKNIYGYKMGFC